jgi:hypothetical protein
LALVLFQGAYDLRQGSQCGPLAAGDDFSCSPETRKKTHPSWEFGLDEHFGGLLL